MDIRLNARDYVVEVQDDDLTTWIRIPHIRTLTINNSAGTATADTTDFDNAGYTSQEIMQRGATMALSTFDIVDDTTGVAAGALARLQEIGALFGYQSLGKIRFRNNKAANWIVWNCTVDVGEQGGGTNDKSGWSATITRDGAPTTVAVG
jgi:hypothetical protein